MDRPGSHFVFEGAVLQQSYRRWWTLDGGISGQGDDTNGGHHGHHDADLCSRLTLDQEAGERAALTWSPILNWVNVLSAPILIFVKPDVRVGSRNLSSY